MVRYVGLFLVRSCLLIALIKCPKGHKSLGLLLKGCFPRTWLTAGLGVFLDFASSFLSAASFLPPKLDLGVEVCDRVAAGVAGV